ncbi:hypothetical protein [Sulfuritalea sp.]|uniref:hypothetical protein n=1 Tax=Sulfuritalea sp. TaxID=2480090 RepID=UPI00286E87FB|nr:hypothetical protein [Sulfuritalea sp.]
MNATTPWHDPIVAEIHAAREQLADQYHDDLLAYSKAAEARCQALGLTMAEDQHKTKTAPPSRGTAHPA